MLEPLRAIYMKAARTAGTSILRATFERKLRLDAINCKDHAPRFERWLSRITDDELCE